MKIKDKEFDLYLKEEDLLMRVKELANVISTDYADKKPLFIAILNGSFMFAADLFKSITLDCQISFVKTASYSNTQSSGSIKELIGLNENIFQKHVIVIEDIIDSGVTIRSIINEFEARGVSSLEIVSLLAKPNAIKSNLEIKYVGFEIPNEFVVGYGLDYDGLGRNFKDIYQIKE